MLRNARALPCILVNNVEQAKEFYGSTLGIEVTELPGGVMLHIAGDTKVALGGDPNHVASQVSVLVFRVDDVPKVVRELTKRGVRFLSSGIAGHNPPDEMGIVTSPSGEKFARFKDPAGNLVTLSNQV